MRIWTRIVAIILAVVLVAVTFVPAQLSINTDGILTIGVRTASATARTSFKS